MKYPNKSPSDKQLSAEAKFVNTLWYTPIFTVMIKLLILISWIPNDIKVITIVCLLIIHLFQYLFTFRCWRKEKTNDKINKRNKRDA